MANLFAPLAQVSGNKPLVEFRAGKSSYNSSNNKVTPDKRKGLVQLVQSPDGLLHFIWKDRTTGSVEDDLIIFPEEAVYKKVKQITTGRIFLLEFKESNRRMFFWMQEPKEDKDEEYLNKINEYINNPPNPEANLGPSSPGSLDQNALLQQMLGGLSRGGGSTTGSSASASTSTPSRPPTTSNRTAPAPSTASTTTANAPNVNVGDLQSILSTMGVPQSTADQQRSRTSLSQVMNADQIIPIVMSNQEIINRLLPLLPEERRTVEELQLVLRSPQFHQSLDVFAHALQSGQLGEMLRQFGIQSQASGQPTTIEAFLRSLQQQAQQKPGDKKDDKMDTA